MGNLIKMDLRRLFLSKLFYISMGVVAVINILLTGIVPLITKFFFPGEAAKDLMISSLFVNPFQVSLLLFILFVSMISFAYADIANGYIKNIAGQISKKSNLIVSKYIIIGIHNFIFLLSGVISGIIGSYIGSVICGYKVVVDEQLLPGVSTFMIKWLLTMAISAILLFITTGIKSKNLASIIAVILGTGALGLVYMGLNAAITNIFKLTDSQFNIGDYTPDQLVNSVNVATNTSVINALIVGIVCSVLFIALTIKVFESRDVK